VGRRKRPAWSPGKGRDERVFPGPVAVDPEVESSSAADQADRGAQQPTAQLLGFGGRERAVQEQQPGPGEQVAGEADELDPDGVDVQLPGRQMGQAGALGAADPVLDPGVRPVAGLEGRLVWLAIRILQVRV